MRRGKPRLHGSSSVRESVRPSRQRIPLLFIARAASLSEMNDSTSLICVPADSFSVVDKFGYVSSRYAAVRLSEHKLLIGVRKDIFHSFVYSAESEAELTTSGRRRTTSDRN